MTLAQPVYDSRGRVLLTEGRTIHPTIVSRLNAMGIHMLIVEDEVSSGITLNDLLDMPSWMDLVQGLQSCYRQAKDKNTIVPKQVFDLAGKLLSELQHRPVLLPVPVASATEELAPSAHAVNVTIWSLLVGRMRGYTALQLRDLAVGCLLHDIGKALATSDSEHPEAGFQLIKKHREFNLMSAHIAFQHHEAVDGSGFPRGIQGAAYLEMAQICSIANQFENKLSEMTIPPHEVLEWLMSLSGSRYVHEVVQAFSVAVPAYMPGTRIRMQDGRSAVVMSITTHMQRPVIRYEDTQEVLSLAEHNSVMISGIY
ncbi:HD-GYP domain-containing protein [Paenibacillus cremeus]|uniref:HD domain-containing protein n=1 Tax=Paenibacillus cremeus TaxID=2163881 RepID=A0A559KBL5_9BACL|nr:HD domain-containing phosphohydrolase [Paenibacillus cremeus]TVY09493.1 HD domain-containing protein [Paenibacillus cremeus]